MTAVLPTNVRPLLRQLLQYFVLFVRHLCSNHEHNVFLSRDFIPHHHFDMVIMCPNILKFTVNPSALSVWYNFGSFQTMRRLAWILYGLYFSTPVRFFTKSNKWFWWASTPQAFSWVTFNFCLNYSTSYNINKRISIFCNVNSTRILN